MKHSILALICLCIIQVQFSLSLAANSDSQGNISTVYLIRHFEKQVATNATGKDVSLSAEGKNYALALPQALLGANIKEIYSSPYKRTRESAYATAKAFSVEIQEYDPRKLTTIASHAINSNANMLIVGHSNTTPELFALLGCYELHISETDYNQVYVVEFKQGIGTMPAENDELSSEKTRSVNCREFSLSLTNDN